MSNLLNRLDAHFVGTAAVAGAALMGATQKSEAAIVHSGTINLVVPSTTAGFYLNVVTGVSGITPAAAPGWDLNPWSSSTLQIWANNAASPNDGVIVGLGSSTTLVDNLAPGTLIDGTATYGRSSNTETTGATAFLVSSDQNIIGFRFLNEGTATINFGWARFSTAATLGAQPRTLVEYAYEDTGAAINAGAVPAPGAAGLLALGSIGFLGRRRK